MSGTVTHGSSRTSVTLGAFTSLTSGTDPDTVTMITAPSSGTVAGIVTRDAPITSGSIVLGTLTVAGIETIAGSTGADRLTLAKHQASRTFNLGAGAGSVMLFNAATTLTLTTLATISRAAAVDTIALTGVSITGLDNSEFIRA